MTRHHLDAKTWISKETGQSCRGVTSGGRGACRPAMRGGDGSPPLALAAQTAATDEGLEGGVPAEIPTDAPIANALQKLARAFEFSVDCDRSKWDFAVELADLDALGVSHDELRWMIGKGLVEQAREIVESRGMGRAFEPTGGFSLAAESCFVVTAAGLQLAKDLTTEAPQGGGGISASQTHVPLDVSTMRPTWDDQRHELRLGDVLVKRFKWRAINQEAILAAFHEEGWPPRIDDPLPPVPETDPKRRLSDTIKCLNRKQQNSLLRFSGDGTGEGVLWNLVIAATK